MQNSTTFSILTAIACVGISACSGSGDPTDGPQLVKPEYKYQSPVQLDDGWPVAKLDSAFLDPKKIVKGTQAIKSGLYGSIDSLLIAQRGSLVHEEYFKQTAELQHEMRSVTKSVVSILAGIALDHGFVQSFDDGVLDYLDQYSLTEKQIQNLEGITLSHLLTMSSGLDCDDTDAFSAGREQRMFDSDDWVRFFLTLEPKYQPGDVFSYCAASVMAMIGVLEKATGQPVDEFAADYLFDLMGINEWSWDMTPQGRAQPNGLYLRSRDLLKIGQIMSTTDWQSIPVVSSSWRNQATTHKVELTQGGSAGYLWWLFEAPTQRGMIRMYYAWGRGGQTVVIIPEYELVIAMTGSEFSGAAWDNVTAFFNEVIIPAL